MPHALFPELVAAVYDATRANYDRAPTSLLAARSTIFRTQDPKYYSVDKARGILNRLQADAVLEVRNSGGEHRWSGPSITLNLGGNIRKIGGYEGLYCSLQQQATVNETHFYVNKGRAQPIGKAGAAVAMAPLSRPEAMSQKCVFKIELMAPILAVDLSPHNPGLDPFLSRIYQAVRGHISTTHKGWNNLRDAINDPMDCSVARGLGLGFASLNYLALISQTVRPSERSPLERGDNVVFFGHVGQRIANLSIVEVFFFDANGPALAPPIVYPVQF